MAITPKRLITGSQIAASATTYYTTPVNTKTTISAMTLINTTANPRLVTVHLIANGGSASASNTILTAQPIGAGQTYIVSEAIGQTIETEGFIQALCDAATAVTIIASGYEQVGS